jgi:hypothetical protein
MSSSTSFVNLLARDAIPIRPICEQPDRNQWNITGRMKKRNMRRKGSGTKTKTSTGFMESVPISDIVLKRGKPSARI